ncbi:hypothetical protein MMC12_003406 [Toensbergia leucococca]|nr:hypothetical protein [Toensbergia leucococca]
MVEWKRVEKSVEDKLVRRIQSLTSMMSSISDTSFHSLKCLGYLCRETDRTFNLYAYVYEIVDLNLEQSCGPTVPTVRSLSELLVSTLRPSLSHRVRFAQALAETVLQLHTSGWLHKAIHSSNVLFIDRGEFQWKNRSSLGPFLAGYEYARADNPLEMTEDTPSSLDLDLYRHPHAQGLARMYYSKAFDLYALGCVLLEIALWAELREIFFQVENETSGLPLHPASQTVSANEQAHLKMETINRCKARLDDKEAIKPVLEKVSFHAGDIYSDIIGLCFYPLKEDEGNDKENDEDSEASIKTQLEIVKAFTQLKC